MALQEAAQACEYVLPVPDKLMTMDALTWCHPPTASERAVWNGSQKGIFPLLTNSSQCFTITALEAEVKMKPFLCGLWRDDQGQDIAEYAVMLAVILVLVVGTVQLVGTNSNTIFSQVASAIQ